MGFPNIICSESTLSVPAKNLWSSCRSRAVRLQKGISESLMVDGCGLRRYKDYIQTSGI